MRLMQTLSYSESDLRKRQINLHETKADFS